MANGTCKSCGAWAWHLDELCHSCLSSSLAINYCGPDTVCDWRVSRFDSRGQKLCAECEAGWAYQTAPEQKGRTKDTSKPRMTLLVWPFVVAMARVMTKGVNKPGRTAHSWATEDDGLSRYNDAKLRHAAESLTGLVDEDSGEDHDVMVACNAMICWALRNGVKP